MWSDFVSYGLGGLNPHPTTLLFGGNDNILRYWHSIGMVLPLHFLHDYYYTHSIESLDHMLAALVVGHNGAPIDNRYTTKRKSLHVNICQYLLMVFWICADDTSS